MSFTEWGKYILKGFIICIESFLYLELVCLSISLFYQIIQFFRIIGYYFYFRDQINYIFFSKNGGALSAKVILFF